jgi:hypothetical protein
MDELKYGKIGEANSRAEAEIIESFLKAEGIDVELVEESISLSAYVLAQALVEIFVPKEQFERALELLKPFEDIQLGEENTDKGE